MPDQKWIIDFESNSTEEEYHKFFEKQPKQKHNKPKFERDVSENPYHHPKHRRIEGLKGKDYKGLYRWASSNTRVTYLPVKPIHTVFVVETTTATSASYKKR